MYWHVVVYIPTYLVPLVCIIVYILYVSMVCYMLPYISYTLRIYITDCKW